LYWINFESDIVAAIEKMLTGMIVLSGFETGGERLQAALDAGDQEEEHSCFSDNTHRDMIQDVQGVSNVWNGSYTRTDGTTVSGPSLKDLVNEVDADLAGRLDAQIEESLSLANALQTPFDQEISPGNEGNARVQALVIGLQAQEQILFEVFDLFGFSVEIFE
jgi:putative iron-regulated protein